jgi:hypothetical protein
VVEPSIQRFSRKCSVTGREILPGEVYYSSLQETTTGIQRLDYSASGWQGPPEDCFGWWKSRLPLPSQVRIEWAPESVLIGYLERCLAAARWDVLQILALALARRRIVTLEYATDVLSFRSPGQATPSRTSGAADGMEGEGGGGELLLTIRRTGDTHRIPQVDLSTLDIAAIQTELDQHLFTDQLEEDAADDERT